MTEKYPHYLQRLENATRDYWDKKALNDIGGRSYTFGQMAARIEKFHIFFDAIGLGHGDHVALCAHNGARWGMSYMAVVTNDTVVVPILADFLPDAIEHLVQHSDAVGFFTTADKWAKMDISHVPALRFVIDIDDWALLYSADESITKAYEEKDAAFEAKFPAGFGPQDAVYKKGEMDSLAMINYTSGSTGTPKGVMLTNRNFSATVDYCQHKVPAGPQYSMVSMLPMAHMYGLVIEFIYPVCNGSAIYWLGKTPTPAALMKAFAEVKPHLLITVPLVIEKIFKAKIKPTVEKPLVKFLCKIPGIRQIIFSKIRNGLLEAFGGEVFEFIFGGAAINPEVENWLHAIKFPYSVGYGMTEANPLLAYDYHTVYVKGSCGRAVDCTTVRVDSADPAHVVGEIQAKGDNICIGYYKNEEATAAAFTADGYLKTGDLGIIAPDGSIFLKGRSKSMILGPSGQNIYPEEVEAVVNNQPYVLESVVVDREGKLVALVFPDAAAIEKDAFDAETLPELIRSGANKALPAYSQLSKVELREEAFEKTPKMSIKRFLYS